MGRAHGQKSPYVEVQIDITFGLLELRISRRNGVGVVGAGRSSAPPGPCLPLHGGAARRHARVYAWRPVFPVLGISLIHSHYNGDYGVPIITTVAFFPRGLRGASPWGMSGGTGGQQYTTNRVVLGAPRRPQSTV